MQCKLYTDVHKFYKDTYSVLMRHEAQNMAILGNMIIGHEGTDKTGWRDPANWLMAAVSDEEGIQLTALMTPLQSFALYATDNIVNPNALNCLIDELKGYEILSIKTEKNLAERFAEEYTAQRELVIKTSLSLRIYELKSVNPDIKQFGDVRLLDERDMYFFPYWAEASYAANIYGNTTMSIPHDAEAYRYRLSSMKLYVLEDDGIPVCMAGITSETQTAAGVAYVYTPPYFRGRGYASSCVAQISQMALDKGFTRCVLYTDLMNPTSNSIYQKIGYKPVCDSLFVEFAPKSKINH